jgi:3-phenylpropionate/cinnamic acid dioxygenase small subunit
LERVKVPVGDPVYNQVLDLLYTEAELLDEDRLEEWLELLGEEVSYRMPIRVTVERGEGRGFSPGSTFFDDDRMRLSMRVQRIVSSPNAHSEVPPTRSRRFVTNLRVELEGDDILARSSVLLLRSRWDMKWFEFLSARRDDVLRRVGDDLKIVRREILIDQVVLDSPNLSVFL